MHMGSMGIVGRFVPRQVFTIDPLHLHSYTNIKVTNIFIGKFPFETFEFASCSNDIQTQTTTAKVINRPNRWMSVIDSAPFESRRLWCLLPPSDTFWLGPHIRQAQHC